MKEIEMTWNKLIVCWLVVIAIMVILFMCVNDNDFQPVNEGMNGNIGGAR